MKRLVEEAAFALGGLNILATTWTQRVGAFVHISSIQIDALLPLNVHALRLILQAAIANVQPGGGIASIGSNIVQWVPFDSLTVTR